MAGQGGLNELTAAAVTAAAVGLARVGGVKLDREQITVVANALAGGKTPTERVVAVPGGIDQAVPVLSVLALAWLVLSGAPALLWFSGPGGRARGFNQIRQICEADPMLERQVDRMSRLNGGEEIRMRSGARLLFRSASQHACRGYRADRVIIDQPIEKLPPAFGPLIATAAQVITWTN